LRFVKRAEREELFEWSLPKGSRSRGAVTPLSYRGGSRGKF